MGFENDVDERIAHDDAIEHCVLALRDRLVQAMRTDLA